MSIATLDLGTHTFLLLIARPKAVGDAEQEHRENVTVLAEALRFVRLGEGLDATGRLSPAAIQRGLEVLREYRQLIDAHHGRAFAVGTQALREATNASEFLIPAQKILGCRVEVVTGYREAELSFRAARASFPELSQFVLMDVGGGSTEFALANVNKGEISTRVSLPIGAVRLHEACFKQDPVTPDEVASARSLIERALGDLPAPIAQVAQTGPCPLIGIAGTVTTLAAMHLGLPAYDPKRVHGLELHLDAVDALIDRLIPLTIAERKHLQGLEPQRADVILAGALLVRTAMHKLGVGSIRVCDRGVRWGLLYEQLGA